MVNEINDKWIQMRLTEIISNFLGDILPNSKETYITPFLPEALKFSISQPEELKKHDLYCNLKVLIGNNRFFLNQKIFTTPVIQSCSMIILSYRNRLAHPSLMDEVSLEQMLIDYIAINRLISLLPTKEYIQGLIEETRSYIGGVLIYLTKEYFNSEITNQGRKKLVFVDADGPAEPETMEYDEQELLNKITISECKQQLRRLRSQIQEEHPESPSWKNLLRESLIEKLVTQRITNAYMFEELLEPRDVRKTDENQFVYFSTIENIINRL
jgi:hypothetical protein